MLKTFTALVVAHAVLASVPLNAAVSTETIYDQNSDAYRTKGAVTIAVPHEIVSTIAASFDQYDQWSLDGTNGAPGNPRGFITLLRHITYVKDSNLGIFDLTYDLDLPWPFRSSGNHIGFQINAASYDKQKRLKQLHFRLTEKNVAIDYFNVTLDIHSIGHSAMIVFSCNVKFAYWLSVFFNVEGYKKNVEWRVIKVIENLQKRAQQIGQKIKKHPSKH